MFPERNRTGLRWGGGRSSGDKAPPTPRAPNLFLGTCLLAWPPTGEHGLSGKGPARRVSEEARGAVLPWSHLLKACLLQQNSMILWKKTPGEKLFKQLNIQPWPRGLVALYGGVLPRHIYSLQFIVTQAPQPGWLSLDTLRSHTTDTAAMALWRRTTDKKPQTEVKVAQKTSNTTCYHPPIASL